MTDFDFIKDEELEALTGGVNSNIISSEEVMDEGDGSFIGDCCNNKDNDSDTPVE